jgi:hypothetical protein
MHRIEQYAREEALNQSLIKALLNGIGVYKNEKKKDVKHFLYGQAVDTLLLSPKEFYDIYFVPDVKKRPSDSIVDIIQSIYDKDPVGDLREKELLITTAVNEKEYYTNRKIETRIAGVITDGSDYWNALKEKGERILISIDEYQNIEQIVNSFKTHQHTLSYFINEDDCEYLSQYPVYWEIDGIPCKGLIDYIIINHKRKIIQVIDIKTIGSSTLSFPESAKRYRYDIQAAWYSYGLLASPDISFIKDTSSYDIQPFRFLVESTKHIGICPLVYRTSKKQLIDAWQDECKRGLELYKWHEENGWDYDRSIMEGKGELELILPHE